MLESFKYFLLFLFYSRPLTLSLPYLLLNLNSLMAQNERKWKYYRSLCRCYYYSLLTFGIQDFNLASHPCIFHLLIGLALQFPLRCANSRALCAV